MATPPAITTASSPREKQAEGGRVATAITTAMERNADVCMARNPREKQAEVGRVATAITTA